MKPSTPLTGIAASLGISTSTVSRALRRPELVNKETRAAIHLAAQKAGYTIEADRPAARGTLTTVGLVVPDIENPFFAVMVKSVLNELRRTGVSLVVADTNEEPLGEGEIISTMLPRVDGLILASSRLDQAAISRLVDSKPLVLINREIDGIPSILIDQRTGMRQAVEHLAALGHHRIGYVEGPSASWSNTHRRESFLETMSDLGYEPTVIGPYAPRFEGGVQAADIAVSRGLTAVVAYNDLMAFGIMSRLASRDVAVPAAMSVVGSDDVPAASIWAPALTSIDGFTADAGRTAAQALMRCAQDKEHVPARRILSQLIVRASTGLHQDERTSSRHASF